MLLVILDLLAQYSYDTYHNQHNITLDYTMNQTKQKLG